MAFTRKDFLRTSALATFGGAAFSLSNPNQAEAAAASDEKKIRPKALKKGDTLGLVAPASPIYDASEFDEMLINVQNLGFNLKLAEHVRTQYGYLAGTDAERAGDVMTMFQDDEVDGIMCIRGGWGCNRILPLLDYQVIKENPKVFCGFSDITSLHMAFYEKSDLISFHGPVGKSEWTDMTTKAFKDIIKKGKKRKYSVPPEFDNTFVINPGTVTGRMLGGNLTVLVSMIGSDYLPDFEDAILYVEDVGENVYRIDRLMMQLKLSGILDEIAGFVFGKCTDCDAGENSLTLKQVLNGYIKPLNIPAFSGAMISHDDNNITIPVGIEATIDSEHKTIQLLQSGVV